MKSNPHIAVIGAGAFGGWTALHLLERGARVTLLDAWGPGNSRASSGGETRIMRGAYGPDQPYTELAGRALKLWARYERRWKRRFLHRIGVLWMAQSSNDAFERGSLKSMRQTGIKFQELSARELDKRWPQVCFDGVDWAIYEPECGYLEARSSCLAVVEAFVSEEMRVVMVDRDEAALKAHRNKHGDAVIPLVTNLLDPKDCASLLPRVLEKAGQLDILHANAGAPTSAATWSMPTLGLSTGCWI